MAKNPPAKQKARVRSLGQEEPLKKEMAPHSSILAWRMPWTEEPGGIQSLGLHSQTRLGNRVYTPWGQQPPRLKALEQQHVTTS